MPFSLFTLHCVSAAERGVSEDSLSLAVEVFACDALSIT